MTLQTEIADYHNPAHQRAIIALMDHYARDPMGGGEPLSEFARLNLVAGLAAFRGSFSILCFDADKPVGLITCLPGFSTFKAKPLVNIHDVVVDRAWRGRGVAQRLLGEVEAVARRRGCCKLTLEVLEGNRVARRAYEKCGFGSYHLDPKAGNALFWEKLL